MTHRHSPDLVPLRLDHAYLRGAPESAYWSIAPHLIQQGTDSSCSLATAVMLINAVRGHEGHLRSAGPVSEASLLDRLGDQAWRAAVAQNGDGLSLTEFAAAMERALHCYECAGRWNIAITPVTDADAAIADLRGALIEMESGGSGFAAANFHLDLFYGDGVDVGHFSPIGAYDAARDRVLMLDVYKKDYEPVWAPLPRLARAMATQSRKTGEPRGYAVVQRR
ncbi:phytochelatin synthase family protein [Dongia deserti]|uniref:phytochelatin synthase family protein n=1 Tax=Dongia deserti TaxID=2268030 RepID=UPI0013C44EE3|nr:phytochelatin synthase family protein [Dongia deserti]